MSAIRREKRFVNPLSDTERLHYRIVRENGTVVEAAIVYEIDVSGRSCQVCRVDNAHGELHLDRLDTQGNSFEKRMLGHAEPRHLTSRGFEALVEVMDQERARFLRDLGLPEE